MQTDTRVGGNRELDVTKAFAQAPAVRRDALISCVLTGAERVTDDFDHERKIWNLVQSAWGRDPYFFDLHTERPVGDAKLCDD